MPLQRIAIVNRGEPAMRLINAVAEHRVATGRDVRTIALYTDADARAMFVREADEAYPLGPATYVTAEGHRKVAYLDYDLLARVLVEARADAVWCGWGFVSEHAAFVELCDRLGITFIGPTAEVMRRLGDKITSKQIAESAGVPVAAWSGGPVRTSEDALEHARRLGFPVMLKATAGGGGRGIRRVDAADGLVAAFDSAQAEARGAFGDETLFVESLVSGARHIEVQIIGDTHGTVWPVGVRDCSVQRRNQKIIEEAPSPVLTTEQDAFIKDAAARLGVAAGYSGAGTVEFLYDEASEQFFFMEVNARLQVEHPITEQTTGVDMVKLQLHVAEGGALEGDAPATVGHAIEARINAEDPDRGFAPAPGRIDLLRMPAGPGVRVDSGVEEGDQIASEFDSMVAKVIATGGDRDEAIARLDRALGQMRVVIENGITNKGFVRELLDHDDYLANRIDVGWVDRLEQVGDPAPELAAAALVAAAIAVCEEQHAIELAAFEEAALRGRPEVDDAVGQHVELRHHGTSYSLTVGQVGPASYRLLQDGTEVLARVEPLDRASMRLTCGGRSWRVLSAVHGGVHAVEVDGVTFRIADDEGGVVRAPSPAVVVQLLVEPGQAVAAGDRLAVIEAMKMESTILAEYAGTVRQVDVHANTQVGTGTPLMVIDRAEEADDGGASSARIDLAVIAVAGWEDHGACRHYLDDLRRLLLGWDVSADRLDRYELAAGFRLCPDDADPAEIRLLEEEILSVFIDVIALFRREPTGDDLRRSSGEYLFDYLRDLSGRGAGLPSSFLDQLRRALAHYGVDSLEPTRRLEEALLRIAKAHARIAGHVGPILRVLEDRLDRAGTDEGDELRELLDRLIEEARGRYPEVHDIAREVSYAMFDEPFLESVRDEAYARAAADLAALEAGPDPQERAALIRSLVACPQPLKSTLSRRFGDASRRHRQDMLEVMTRRYYRIRELGAFRTGTTGDTSWAASTYRHDRADIAVVSVHVDASHLREGARTVLEILDDLEETDDVVLDVYAWREHANSDTEATLAEVRDVLADELGHLRLRRIVVAISHPEGGVGMSGVLTFTFRPDRDGGYREADIYRDMHPMMSKRLELWRLDGFDIQRMPSVEDVYAFHAVAPRNPRDERVVAVGEVRDLTPVRGDTGEVVRLPEFERTFHELLGAVRRFQARRPPHRRLPWNQVILHVWPALDLPRSDIARLVDRLAPETDGLGLERVAVRVRMPVDGRLAPRVLEISNPSGRHVTVQVRPPSPEPIRPLDEYEQKVARLRQRGLIHPHELIAILTPDAPDDFPAGRFEEHELEGGRLVPVDRGPGRNPSNVVVGLITNVTDKHPDGMTRVVIASDPSRGMGNLAEPECRRIVAALDLAEERGLPVEWFATSAGALISMDSGTENMDWIGLVLRRLVEFTQGGGEVNVVVTGINVGAQPYWNAEATMLMHTRGILVMMPESAMVLTGKEALDYSGGVSAEDNQGIGGYERIMGPNGQAQYFARDVAAACRVLLAHYDHAYLVPGERFPRAFETTDPTDRDVGPSPHRGDVATVGEVFSEETNPGRKLPFEMRDVMAAVVDADRPPLERWFGMQDAEIAITWDAHLGGRPVTLIGFESKQLPRLGAVPADGPAHWTSGTLFPRASKKVARAINAASANRPLVILANLSGFDGSPESMRDLQLEYGAEIGRAIVNFDGPIVFCVVSRYHGGAFVVFSKALNDHMEVAAVAGSRASVIGGAPAAAVVFARDVRGRVEADPRVVAAREQLAAGAEKSVLADRLAAVRAEVTAEKRGEVADEFDAIHDIERARSVGSVDRIIEPSALRPYLVAAVRRGMAAVRDGLPDRPDGG